MPDGIYAAPATLTLRDIYPNTGAKVRAESTEEKTNPSVAKAGANPAGVIAGVTGLPMAVIWILAGAGLLVALRFLVEKA